MPRISEHVGIERKPKLGGGGPGKIPHRHGYGGGDDGDHGEPDDFVSPKDRLRRYREYLDFYHGHQWTGTPRRRERRLTFQFVVDYGPTSELLSRYR